MDEFKLMKKKVKILFVHTSSKIHTVDRTVQRGKIFPV